MTSSPSPSPSPSGEQSEHRPETTGSQDPLAVLYAAATASLAETRRLIERYQDALVALREVADSAPTPPTAEPLTVAAVLAEGAVDRLLGETTTGDWSVLVAPESVDGEEAVGLVRAASDAPGDVLIDLRGTSLLTTDGARALYDIHRHAELRGRMAALLGPKALVRTVLEVMGLAKTIPVVAGETTPPDQS
jgi:anti-anti-sigma regulatory factor